MISVAVKRHPFRIALFIASVAAASVVAQMFATGWLHTLLWG